MKKLEFVSYDGEYPALCFGELVLKLGDEIFQFPKHSLYSGGGVNFDEDWSEHVSQGPWEIMGWPENFPEELKEEAVILVNAHVDLGCCGGCV